MTTNNIPSSYDFDCFKEATDEYFKGYTPYILKRTREWLNNNWLDRNDKVEAAHIRIDALSFAYQYYLEIASNMFSDDINAARKYWFKTVWFKLLDYLNYTYRDIVTVKAEKFYQKTHFVYIDSFEPGELEYLSERILKDHHTPSSEYHAIQKDEQNSARTFYQEIKNFAPVQYRMHKYTAVSEHDYVQMMHDCIDNTLETLKHRDVSSNERATDIKSISEKHNINYRTLHEYFIKFKRDVRKHMKHIEAFLSEKNTPKEIYN